MKLYKVWQDEVSGYETFSDMVVCAEDFLQAASLHPYSKRHPNDNNWSSNSGSWCTTPEMAHVEYLGEAVAGLSVGVICASYHAG